MIRAILTDIEGTTSSLSFVKETLFPYARARMADFVRSHARDATVQALLADAKVAAGDPSMDDEHVIARLVRWIDEDRKITPLKALQGLIWEEGYRNRDFFGHVYDDAVRRLKAWHEQGISLYVFSSGSVHAQRLLFGHTAAGDLQPLFSGYFDTRIGAKQEPAAYSAIARELNLPPSEILFLSDIEAELDAAREAGYKTFMLVREGGAKASHHPQGADFDAIRPELL
ncbi:acireductone synthase [Methylococcus capsulatus]|jgi:enolase-phosphatase E1|uniref:Enolase-phosphatase E1 n=1 Tax=Methylococcus capsulatus TaxID=414 RepID=A0AA35V1U2_METCP|nr:acireductone synthase [Methylococcus capsulatus]CAI8745887.1 Enolase-phosphatase E1 [Methylococcus capsulatus]